MFRKVGFLVIRNSTACDVILGNNLLRHMVNLYNETDLEGNSILVPILNIYRRRKDYNAWYILISIH